MSEIYPDSPGFKGPSETSEEAALAMASVTARLQRAALAAIRRAGERGLTAEELADTLRVDRVVIQPRTSELRRKHLVRDSRLRRLNKSGKRAIVWMAVEASV